MARKLMPTEKIAAEILGGRKLLLWIGAGNSHSAGIPTDQPGEGGFAYNLAVIHYGDNATVRAELGEAFRLAELAARLGKPRIRDLIRQQGWSDLPLAPAHRAIGALAAEGFHIEIVTTNYDPLLERGLTDSGLSPEVISSATSVPRLAEDIVPVVKIHGCPYTDTNPNNLLMLEAELVAPPGWVVAFLNGRLLERTVVFVGFSGNADYIWQAIEGAVAILQGGLNNSYAVDVQPQGEVFDERSNLGRFYDHCHVRRENYSPDGSDSLLPHVADIVFRGLLRNALQDGERDAVRHRVVDSTMLLADIGRMSYVAVRAFARKLRCLRDEKLLRVHELCLSRVLKWMLIFTSDRILEHSSFRPILACPYQPGPNSLASAPIVFIDGLGHEALFCRDQVREASRTLRFRDEFQLDGMPRCYCVILNCIGTIGPESLDVIPRESETTIDGYDPMICIDENTLQDDIHNLPERFIA